ncbi:AlpA family transcriptional regulator [uncultured Lamprocystis sp.]|jgi:prophage regulatory protein|uniref:helix-turn-helix transcriptional regulator n=1 Tax=uncultured Lamprocystis sp. TaxID=543132 RepID=UPI0025E31E23|nr:AlpA family transcriptional regulator [uncultured Lamprocystis sp.]
MLKTTNTAAAILRRPAVVKLTGVSYTTLYRKMRAGEFPQRVRLGKNAVGWREAEVQAWINSRESVVTAPVTAS